MREPERMRTSISFTLSAGDRQRLRAIIAYPMSSQKHVFTRACSRADAKLSGSCRTSPSFVSTARLRFSKPDDKDYAKEIRSCARKM
jgi:hypothetical protein